MVCRNAPSYDPVPTFSVLFRGKSRYTGRNMYRWTFRVEKRQNYQLFLGSLFKRIQILPVNHRWRNWKTPKNCPICKTGYEKIREKIGQINDNHISITEKHYCDFSAFTGHWILCDFSFPGYCLRGKYPTTSTFSRLDWVTHLVKNKHTRYWNWLF